MGFKEAAIAELQRWLRKSGLRLAQCPLTGGTSEFEALMQAALLLDAYHFDVATALVQLDEVVHPEGQSSVVPSEAG